MKPISRHRRLAFTLVEVIAATAIMAMLTTSSFAIVRTAHTAWMRHRDDAQQRREGMAALQHIVRLVRQATEVAAISGTSDMSGSITLQMPDGTSAIWDHNSGTSQVLYGTVTPVNLLAEGITQLNFVGLTANGSGVSTDPALIHAVRCTVQYALVRPSGTTTELVTCLAWLRAW